MSTTQDEARKYLLGLLPPGIEKLYDLDPGGDFYYIFDAAAYLLRVFGFDLLDRLRTEHFPGQVVDKLPDWERFLGIARFFIARFGSTAQRQAAVVSKIRERGAFIDSLVQSVLGPLLGYEDPSQLEVLSTNRSDLRLAHTYSTEDLLTVADGDTGEQVLDVIDGGKVSAAGVRVLVEFGDAGPFTFSLTLTAPDDITSKTWEIADQDGDQMIGLFGKEFAAAEIRGNWTLSVANDSGVSLPVILSVFVEGIARNQNTGGASAHWGVYADPTLLAAIGYSDFEAVMAAIARIKHSDSVGRLILSKEPWPGVTTGLHAAIPGRCIPSAAT